MTSPAGRWSPFTRTPHEVWVFWTRTGEVVSRMPVTPTWSYTDSLVWASLGSFKVDIAVPVKDTLVARRTRDVLRTIAREGPSLSLCLVRRAPGRPPRAMTAGYVVDLDSGGAVTCANIGKLFDSRILIGDAYRLTPTDQRGDLTFDLGPRDLVIAALTEGMTGARRDLPVQLPPLSGRSGERTVVQADDLESVYELVKKQTERDDGPEVHLSPTIVSDAPGEPDRIVYLARVGTPLVGTAATWRPEQGTAPTWHYAAGNVDLGYSVQYGEMVDTGYVPGDSVGSGTGTDRRRIVAVHQQTRSGDRVPALERVDRQNTSSANAKELAAQAREYVTTHSWPTHDWTISVQADAWPLLGETWQLGDMTRMDVRHHPMIDDGYYWRRPAAISHDAAGKLALTTSDGSELGLARWVP